MTLNRLYVLILVLAVSLSFKFCGKNLKRSTTFTDNNPNMGSLIIPSKIQGINISQFFTSIQNQLQTQHKPPFVKDREHIGKSHKKSDPEKPLAENGNFFSDEIEEEWFSDWEDISPRIAEPQESCIELDAYTDDRECCEPRTDYLCCYNPWATPKMITLRHIQGLNRMHAGFSSGTNYSTLDLLLSYDYCPGHFLPMFDLRGHFLCDSIYATNVGLATRYIPSNCDCFCNILGLNIFYDWREGSIGNFEQFGIGLEVLANRWDFRFNLYIPFGDRQHHHQCTFDEYEGDYYIKENIFENAISYFFNAELGLYLYYDCNFSLYLAGGPYFIEGRKCSDKTQGGEVRIKPQYKDYFALDFSYRYDSFFRGIWQAEIVLQIPLYSIKNQNLRPCCLTDWQIYQPIERFEVVPVGIRHCFESNF